MHVRRSLALALAILVAGCSAASVAGPTGSSGPTPGPSSEAPSASVPATVSPANASPTAIPSTSAAPPAGSVVLAKDSVAKDITDDLLVRSAAGTGADSKKLEPLLPKGTLLYVVDGPVEANGYQWYRVEPFDHDVPSGWVAAASRDGERWLEPGTASCPPLPIEFADIARLASFERLVGLACFGDHPLTFTARILEPEATCGVSAGWTIKPAWLDQCVRHDVLTDLSGDQLVDQMDAVLAPNVSSKGLVYGIEPKTWLKVKVTGQFDHPAARTCRARRQDTDPPPPAEVVMICRETFVITSIKAAK